MKLTDLHEGLKASKDESGRTVIDYKHDNAPDDPFFKHVTKSSGVEIKNINLTSDDYSTTEIKQLKQHIGDRPESFQDNMPLYIAMPIFSQGHTNPELQSKAISFFDALKQRNEEKITFSKEGIDTLMKKSADALVYEFVRKRTKLSRFDEILVIPVPSGKDLTRRFTEFVASSIKKQGGNVSVQDLMQKTTPKVGTILRGGRLNPKDTTQFPQRLKTFRPEAYAHMLSAYNDEQLFNFIENREQEIKKEIEEINQQIATGVSDQQKQSLHHEIEALNQELEYIPGVIDKALSRQGSNEQTREQEIKNARGFLRRLTYDRVKLNELGEKLKQGKSATEEGKKTLVVLVDDNVETEKTLVDAYRVLFKNGIVDDKSDMVIAMTMHKVKNAPKDATDLAGKFNEHVAIDNILEILKEMTPGSKFSSNMGHMVARNKQRTLQLKPYNYRVKRTSYEDREQATSVGQVQQNAAQQQAQQAAQQRVQGQTQQVQQPNDPRVLRLAGELLKFKNQGEYAERQILDILNKALEKLGASQ